MSRKARGRESTLRRPDHVELSEKNVRLRIILMAVCIVIALVAFGYAFYNLLSAETGWQEIQAKSDAETLGGKELVFMYNIGASGMGATAELKEVTRIYTEATDEAYKLFSNDTFDNVSNVAYLNSHVNRPIKVDDALYRALSLIDETGNRFPFMGPVAAEYENVFYATYDEEAEAVDPMRSVEVRELVATMARYCSDPDMISLKLEPGNLVTIQASDEYLAFAAEYEITDYLDLSWIRNAFIVDYVADRLTAAGHTLGTISSFDGYCRSLDNSGNSYSFNVYEKLKGVITNVGMMNVERSASIVYFRSFPFSELDRALRYYSYADGDIRSPYFDTADGMSKCAVEGLIGCSDTKSAAELALSLLPVYTADSLDEAALVDLQSHELYAVWCVDHEIRYTGDIVSFSNVYYTEQLSYTTRKMP